MGLFDTIERLNTADKLTASPKPQARILPIPPATASPSPNDPAQNHHQTTAEDAGPDTWQLSSDEIEERRRILNRKPERLSFLSPCPVCHGRAFLHIDGGGFTCRTCQPGLFGYPVEATGADRKAPTITPEDLKPASDIDTPHQDDTASTEPTAQQRAYFRAAWPWITKKREILLAAGWTPATLFRRAKYRWPSGPWGVAWLPVWSRPGVEVTIGQRGEIVFTYSSSGRVITQAAHVEKSKNKINSDR